MSDSDAAKDLPPSSAQFRASLVTIQESLKWLIASSGASAAFVIGGLQLRAVPEGNITPLRGSVLLGAAVIGLGAIFALLFWAARILTLPRLTANQLCDIEAKAGVSPVGAALGQRVSDKTAQWILNQRTYLLATKPTVQALYMDDFVGSRKVLRLLYDGKTAQWGSQTVLPEDELARTRFETVFAAAERQLTLVEDAVHFERTRAAYRRLTKWFPVGVGVLIASIALFAVASRWPSHPPEPRVSKPTNVGIIVRDRVAARLPANCTAAELRGVAVDGTVDRPTVVIAAPQECRGSVIEDGNGVVVIPAVEGAPPP